MPSAGGDNLRAALCAGDVNEIKIGEYSNIQDGAIVHVAKNNAAGASLPTNIGNFVTIGNATALQHAHGNLR